MNQEEEKRNRNVECQTCGWTGKESDLVEVKNLGRNLTVITNERLSGMSESCDKEYLPLKMKYLPGHFE